MEEPEDCWQLTFSTAHCTACGVCVSLCDPDALRLEWATPADVVGGPATLLEAPWISFDDCEVTVPALGTEAIGGRSYCRSCARRRQGRALAL